MIESEKAIKFEIGKYNDVNIDSESLPDSADDFKTQFEQIIEKAIIQESEYVICF